MAEGTTQARMAELASDLFAFSFTLKSGKDPGPIAEVKQRVGKLFIDFEQACRTAGYKPDSIQAAKYALTAYIDETVLAGSLPIKNDWAGNPLQLEFFNDFAAGEEFYNKLKTVRAGGDSERSAVLAVYFLCLTHGLKGMYIDLKGMEERRVLTEQLAGELRAGTPGDPSQLSARWRPPDELPKLVRTTPGWLVPAICAAVAILLVLGLAFTIDIMANGAVSDLTGQGN